MGHISIWDDEKELLYIFGGQKGGDEFKKSS
jgi:hypothetical protein